MAEEEAIATAPPAYTWYITNFSKLTVKRFYSDIFVSDGYRWRLYVYPKGNGVEYLSLYLDVPDSSTLPDGWLRDVESFGFTVVNQICPKDSIIKDFEKSRFVAEKPALGIPKFMPLANIHCPAKGYLVADTLVVEVRVSVSSEPSSDLLTRTKNLLDELSSMNNTNKSSVSSSETSESNVRQSMEQQRKSLLDYLAFSLEASELANAFDEIERISLQLLQHSPNSLEKTILKDLVSRLPTFKQIVSTTKSSIENLDVRKKILSREMKDLGPELGQGQGQLSSYETKYAVLSEEELRLDAEILRLITQKQELLTRKNSLALDLKKIHDQVSTNLIRWKDIDKKSEETDQHWLKAREELAVANLSWKLFQQNLEIFQKSG